MHYTLMLSILFCSLYSRAIEHIEITRSQQDFFKIDKIAQETLTSEDLKNRNLFHGENLWSQFANVLPASGSNRLRYFKIRGIGERSEYDTVPSNSVGVFYDHIDLSGLSGVLSLIDVGRVDILKGPQTFLFGDSALGGNVLIESSTIIDDEASSWLAAGSQQNQRWGGKASTFLWENFALKLGVEVNRSDGFHYNEHLQEHTSARDEVFSFLGSQVDFGAHSLRTSHLFATNNNGNDLWSHNGSFSTLSDRRGHDDQLTHGHSLELTGPVSTASRYLIVGSLSHSDQLVAYDEDWGNNPAWNQVNGWNKNYDFYRSYNRRKINVHTKAILQHDFGELSVSYGLHYYQKREEADVESFRNGLVKNTLSATHLADKFAILANGSYSMASDWQLSLSLRLENQYIEYVDTGGFANNKRSQPVAYNLTTQKKWNRHLFRGTAARGFKGAGFNPELNLTPKQREYDPENVMNYELEWSYSRETWQNHLSVFYMSRRDHQITTSSQDDPNDPSDFTLFVDNAAHSRIYGLEWQMRGQLHSGWTVSGSVGLMQAEFVNYRLKNRDLSLRGLAHSPNYTANLNSHIAVLSDLQWVLGLRAVDSFYFSNSHDQRSQAYTTVDSSLSFQMNSHLRFSLWGRNLFGTAYSQRGFYFGNEPPDFQQKLYTQNAPPLEYGLRASYRF